MRVALVGPYPLDTSRFSGGVETSFFNLIGGLDALDDLELHVVTFARGQRETRQVDEGRVRLHYLPGQERLGNLTLHRSDRRRLRRLLDELRPDLIHAQDALGYGYVCLRAAREEPVVVSIHGIVRETRRQLTGLRARLQVTVAGVALERYCVRNARYLVQPTRYPEEYFGSEIQGEIFDVGNGISEALFALRPAPEPGRVLFAGSLVEGKRPLDLVEAASRMPPGVPVALRLAGAASDPAYSVRLEARVQELGLAARVTLLGPLTAEQMLEEYRRAALLVVSSAQETSPMVIGEAMAAGVPVVSTRVGGVPYLVEEGSTGYLVAVADVEAMAERMAWLLGNERARAEFGAAARRRALERFRSVDVARRVRDVYLKARQDAESWRTRAPGRGARAG